MRMIDADDLEEKMYHEAFEKDSDMQKWDSGCWIRYKLFENVLKEQPTIQPEIIRCKDCKHYWIHKCMDSMPIERCDLGQTFYAPEIDYCSLAERREVTS